MPNQNYRIGDIQVIFTSTLQSGPSVNVDSCAGAFGPEYDIYNFNSQLSSNVDIDAPAFKIKEYNDKLNATITRDSNTSDPAKRIRVSSVFNNNVPYQDKNDSGFFLTQCWSDQVPAAPALNASWADTLAKALAQSSRNVQDINTKASKTLKEGTDIRTAGPLIFSCRDFVEKTLPKLYGTEKEFNYDYQLDSTINVAATITTTSAGERRFCVSWTEKDPGTANTAGSYQGIEKRALVKALITINEKTGLQVRIIDPISTAEVQALSSEYADYSGMPETNSSWESKVNAFVDLMDAVRDGTTGLSSGPLVQHQEQIGNGLFRIQIVRQTDVGGSAWFCVSALFSIGHEGGDTLGIKFEGIKIQFSPEKYFQEREMIKQLRARYREAMQNYMTAKAQYEARLSQAGGAANIVPTNPSPPPTEMLKDPADIILTPPNGQAPTRENIAQAVGLNPGSNGVIDVTLPAAPIPQLSDFLSNTGSNGRVTEGISWSFLSPD